MKKSHKTIALIFAFFAAIVLGNINFFINTFRNNYAIFDLLGGFHSINDPDIFVSYENWNNFDFLLRKNEIKLTKKVNKQYLFINTSKPFRKVYILQNIDEKLDFHLLKGDCSFSISNDRLQINIDIDDIYIRKNIINLNPYK